MQGQKNSRKQKTHKENHNARSSNTQTQRTIKQHARRHNTQHITKCEMQNVKTKKICITENRIQKQKQIVENKNTKCLMQGQKNNSRKQKTYKENHNARSSSAHAHT